MATLLLSEDVNGKTVSLFVDQKKMRQVHPWQHVRLRGLPYKDVKSLAHDTPPKKVTCAGLPRRCAGRLGAQHARKADRGRDARGEVRGLPRRGARGAGRRRCAFAGQPRQHSRHLRPLPRAEVPDGVERRKRAAVPVIPGKRARARHRKRLAEGGRLHGLPRLAPGSVPPTISSRPSTSSTCPQPAASATLPIQQTFMASIHGQGIARGKWLLPRSARTATASTPSSRPAIPIRRSPSATFPATPARAAMRACAFRRSSACPASASPVTWTAITAWPQRAVQWLRPTAPVATACTTSCPPAIRAPASTTPTCRPPAANATRA